MKHFALDYNTLDNEIDKKFYRLADVKDKIVKVCFDIVKFRDGNPDELWQIQSADDGDYIVAKYDMDAVSDKLVEKTAALTNVWNVSTTTNGDINIFYKGFPVIRSNASNVGIKIEDLADVKAFLPTKLASSKELVQSLLKNLSASQRYELLRLYPELQ